MVRAGLEGDVGGGAGDAVAGGGGLLEGDDLGVVAGFVAVGALAEDPEIIYQDAADLRVGAGLGGGCGGEGEGLVHVEFVLFVRVHVCPLPPVLWT